MTVHGKTWTGSCTGCHHEGVEVASRLSHGLRVLCAPCTARPHSMPDANGLDSARSTPAEGNGQISTNRQSDGDRYRDRRVDVAALLAQPPKPIPWRVGDFVADGTVTILSGESGSGKSWLAMALCVGVARGKPVIGLPCLKAPALYIDGEMGPAMFVDHRMRPAGIGAEFELRDAMGLDLSTPADLAWLKAEIQATNAKFVAIDSLRRLMPSKPENDSDAMAPVISALAKVARDTNTAIVLVHHKGGSEKLYRGSTAIRDQGDALFGLLRDNDDDLDLRRLTCDPSRGGKMRYAREPGDVFLKIDPEYGGVVAADMPDQADRPRSATPTADAVKRDILGVLPCKTKTEAARRIGRAINDRTFRDVWAELEAAGAISTTIDRGVVVVQEPRATTTTTTGPTLIEGTGGVVEPSLAMPYPEAVPAQACRCDTPLPAPSGGGDLRCTRCGHATTRGWGSAS